MGVTTRHDATGPACAAPFAPPRRVRQEVREGMAVVVFSAVASTGVALVLLLLMSLVG